MPLGSVRAMVSETGSVLAYYVYTPFGVEDYGASGNPFRFTGQRYDAAIRLYYYRARYYDPELGRFLQTDPVLYADQMNLYAYVGNNPLKWTDPTGMFRPPEEDEYPAAMMRMHEHDLWMLEMQLGGNYTSARDASDEWLYVFGGSRIALQGARAAWTAGAKGIREALIRGPLVGAGLGGATGCVAGMGSGQCAEGAVVGAMFGIVAAKGTSYVNIATQGGVTRYGGGVAVGAGAASGYAVTQTRNSILDRSGELVIGPGESVFLETTGPFNTIEVTNNGDGTVTYTGRRTGARLNTETSITRCVRADGCDE